MNSAPLTQKRTPVKGYEKDEFNNYQNFLYKRALYGLTVYTEQELSQMHNDRKNRINRNHRYAQYIINLYKQVVMNRIINRAFKRLWPDTVSMQGDKRIITTIKEKNCFARHTPEPHYKFLCKFTFIELGISKRQVIGRLIEENVLPHNFFQLTLDDDNRLPKLINKPVKNKLAEVNSNTFEALDA